MIVCHPSILHYDGIYGAPDLVVEVTSPSTARRNFTVKLRAYEKAGVHEYRLANPISKELHVYHLQDGKLVLDNIYTVHPDVEWEKMTEEEKAAANLTVKVSLYDDLDVDVHEIFEGGVDYATP